MVRSCQYDYGCFGIDSGCTYCDAIGDRVVGNVFGGLRIDRLIERYSYGVLCCHHRGHLRSKNVLGVYRDVYGLAVGLLAIGYCEGDLILSCPSEGWDPCEIAGERI